MIPMRSAIRAVSLVLLLSASGPAIGVAQGASSASAPTDSAAVMRAVSDSAPPTSAGTKALQRERKVTRKISELEPVVEWQWSAILATALAMVGAFLLTLPVGVAYKVTKPPEEYDPSVMHSSLILAPTIAGILIVIQGNLATAFSLAGVATAVRFRNSLKDTNDAVYVFVAIAIGLAAGGQALDIGLTISAIFSALMLLLWKSPFRNTGNPQRAAHKKHPHHHDAMELAPMQLAPAQPEPTNRNGDARPPRWAKLTHDGSKVVASMAIRASDPAQARPIIEALLERATKRWRLENTVREEGGKDVTLLYTVQCRKRVPRDKLLEGLRALRVSGGLSVEALSPGPGGGTG